MKYLSPKNSKGFALVFSVVVVSVVVIVTLAVSTIVRKGLDLTSIGQQSMEAFFAADAGIECALYWDVHKRDLEKFRDPSNADGTIKCEGKTIDYDSSDSGSVKTHSFSIDGDFCANVEIEINDTTNETHIRSRGYNTCVTSDSSRVERGLEAFY